jgi:TetR/AcrR family transcriptional regulator
MPRRPHQRTRERILSVAEMLFGEVGYVGTRLHEIAARVGVQKASLFHHFANKDELYRAVVEQGFGETEATIGRVLESEATPADKIHALVEAYIDMVMRHPARTKILLRQSLGDAPAGYPPAAGDRVLRAVAEWIASGQRARVFADVDPLALVLGVVGMVVFFFASAPMLAPDWQLDRPGAVERVKQHVALVTQRVLIAGGPERVAGTARARSEDAVMGVSAPKTSGRATATA